MAFSVSKKILSFKVKKTIKNILKKILPKINNKKKIVKEEPNYDTEINDNLQNEYLEARLRQMIQDSPASICDEDCAVITDTAYRFDQDSHMMFVSFWMNDEDQTRPNYSTNLRYCSPTENETA